MKFMDMKYPYYSPDDDTGTGLKPESTDSDTAVLDRLIGTKDTEALDLLDTEDDKTDDLEVGDGEDLLLDAEDGKEDLLDITSSRGIDLKKIKDKYPDFAKTRDFQELRNAYYRESKFSELFATIEDAQEAAENNETYVKLNDSLINQGEIAPLLVAIKEANPQSLEKITLSFLDSVAKIDLNLFNKAISPMIKRIARDLNTAGVKLLRRNAENLDGKALVATAGNILMHYFEDDKIDTTEQATREDPREKELSEREQKIKQGHFASAFNTAASAVDKHLDKLILDGLDPDKKFNEFTRDTLLDRIKKEVQGQIDHDELHKRRMTSLWKRAEQAEFDRISLSRIVFAYLERARPIIPTVRNKFRSMAIGKKAANDDGERDKSVRMPRQQSARQPERDGKIDLKAVDSKKIDYNKTSNEDIFEGKVKLKA